MTTTTTNPCEQVVTIQEAAALVGRHPDTIRMHLITGRLVGRFLGDGFRGVWIVDKAALMAYYHHRAKDQSKLGTHAPILMLQSS